MSTADEITIQIKQFEMRMQILRLQQKIQDDVIDAMRYGTIAQRPQSPLRLEDCTVVATLDPPGFALHRYRNLQDAPLKVYFGDSRTEAMNTFKLYLITKRLTT